MAELLVWYSELPLYSEEEEPLVDWCSPSPSGVHQRAEERYERHARGEYVKLFEKPGRGTGVPSHSVSVCVCRVRSSSSSSSSRDWFVTHSRKCQEPLIGWPSTSLSPFHSLRELYIASSLLVSHSVSFSPLLPCLECGVVCVYIAWTFSFYPLASLPNRIIADPTSSSRKSPIYIQSPTCTTSYIR